MKSNQLPRKAAAQRQARKVKRNRRQAKFAEGRPGVTATHSRETLVRVYTRQTLPKKGSDSVIKRLNKLLGAHRSPKADQDAT